MLESGFYFLKDIYLSNGWYMVLNFFIIYYFYVNMLIKKFPYKLIFGILFAIFMSFHILATFGYFGVIT